MTILGIDISWTTLHCVSSSQIPRALPVLMCLSSVRVFWCAVCVFVSLSRKLPSLGSWDCHSEMDTSGDIIEALPAACWMNEGCGVLIWEQGSQTPMISAFPFRNWYVQWEQIHEPGFELTNWMVIWGRWLEATYPGSVSTARSFVWHQGVWKSVCQVIIGQEIWSTPGQFRAIFFPQYVKYLSHYFRVDLLT